MLPPTRIKDAARITLRIGLAARHAGGADTRGLMISFALPPCRRACMAGHDSREALDRREAIG